MKIINTEKAPKAVGPYSQAVIAGEFIFCSGQIGIDPMNNTLSDGVDNQTRQIMKNLSMVLEASGSDLTNVIKTTIYVTDMNHYATVNKIYGEYFTIHKPARATVQVSKLPLNALVEIDAIAITKQDECCGNGNCCNNT